MVLDSSGRSADASVIWSPDLLKYKHSAEHPMSPQRLELTMALATSLGILEGVDIINPAACTDAELLRVHSRRYINAVKEAGTMPPGEHPGMAHGLGTADNPTFPDMHEASAAVAGSTLTAAREIAAGNSTRAIAVAGGMHHAMRNAAAGFCVYNDAGVAIAWLLENGFDKIAYVDVDVHHGDGVQAMFYDDPRVMTISLHQHPATLWPMTGWSSEIGDGAAEGTAVNLPMLPGANDHMWLRGFHAVVPGALRAFQPELIVLQAGCDSHREDQLADLSLTVDGHRAAYLAVRALAEEICGGKLLAIGGGGYQLIRVVPRSWTHLMAAMLDREIPTNTPIPEDWRDLAAGGGTTDRVPDNMSDDGEPTFLKWEGAVGGASTDPAVDRATARLDQAILDTRRSVFPLLDLDPDDPRD